MGPQCWRRPSLPSLRQGSPLTVAPLLHMQDCPQAPSPAQLTIQPSLLTVVISMTWEQFQGPLVGILLLRARVFCLPLAGHPEEAAAAPIGTALVGIGHLQDSAQRKAEL